MPTLDIVARLQLQASQFSSEMGSRFAELKTRAASSAQEVRDAFGGAFAEVNRLAQTSLTMPRGASGSLDLSTEIAQLRASAGAADQRALALRELSIAQSAAAAAANVDTQALRLEADASAVASLAEERNAQAIRDRILALEAVQTELNRTTSATELQTAAGQRYIITAGQQRQSTMMLGQQVQDFWVQVSNGGSVATAFSQQVGQAGFALSGMGGRLGAVGAFLMTGWGTATLVALTALVPLVSKIAEMGDETQKAIGKLKKEAEQTEATRVAKARFRETEEGVTAAIREQNEAFKKSIQTQQDVADAANIRAKQDLEKLINIRKTTQALLEQAIAEENLLRIRASAPGQRGENAAIGLGDAAQRVAGLQASAAANDAKIKEAQAALDATRVELAAQAAKRATDPIARINALYDQQAANAKKAAVANGEVTASLTRQLTAIEQKRQAELKAARDAERASRKAPPTLGDQIETERSQRLLTAAERYRGLDENRDNGTLRGLFKQANVNVDPKMVAWCAAFVNAVLKTNGLPGTGSLSARSFLGYGEATDRPVKGDIVVSRRGTGNQGHVGFYEGTDARGNIRVLGGNTGNRVGTETVSRADVLGFRRAPSAADTYKEENEAAKKLADTNREMAADVARINAQWDDQPKLIDRASAQTAVLQGIIDRLKAEPPTAETAQMIADAQRAVVRIQQGLSRPFDDYLRSQREGLEVQRLSLAGRDAEANALQNAIRLQQQQGQLSDTQLATVLRIAQTQEAISRALEDQGRIVGIYTGAVGDMQRGFESFLSDLRNKPSGAIQGLIGNAVSTFQRLQDNLLSNAIFGGIDRDIETYIRKQTGGQTPGEILTEQARDAGAALSQQVGNASTAVSDFVQSIRTATGQIAGAATAGAHTLGGTPISDELYGLLVQGNHANDNSPVLRDVRSSDVLNVGINRLVDNLSKLGIKIPASITDGLKKTLPSVLEGVSFGQLGGSVFSSITGGKDNKLASGIGGAVGEVVGKELGSQVGGMLGKFAGPLGAIAGGVLGSLVGGLFNKPNWSNASVTLNQWGGAEGGQGSGRGNDAIQAATGVSSSVAAGINTIADQLGATIKGLPALTLGTWNDKYRVALTATNKPLHSNNFGPDILKDFGDDQQAAIEYAVRYSISHAVIEGISQASKNILASGQDLQSAINKALLIESVPKSLKEYYDPVGAAIDALNLKFKHIRDAMEEGGATAEQLAQAEQLYNIQLQQTKNSTASASATLKDFLKSLHIGSNSPYSLRDQETTALAQLRPFLDQINAGQAIDQSKYQEAAQAYLDIERQLYGSTAAYFAAMDSVQAATNKAISQIDNVAPIGTPVESPFAKQTANAASQTAANTQTVAEILAQQSEQYDRMNDALNQLLELAGIHPDQGFLGLDRGYVPRKAG